MEVSCQGIRPVSHIGEAFSFFETYVTLMCGCFLSLGGIHPGRNCVWIEKTAKRILHHTLYSGPPRCYAVVVEHVSCMSKIYLLVILEAGHVYEVCVYVFRERKKDLQNCIPKRNY